MTIGESRVQAESEAAAEADPLVQELRRRQAEHPLWNGRFLTACEAGVFTLEDYRVIFQQYKFYSQNFTRFLGGLLACSEDDAFRAILCENLWEESGGARKVEERHSEIFRRFLRKGLRAEDAPIVPSTALFVERVQRFCTTSPSLEVAAFISFGTEGIVARIYSSFVRGLRKAGVTDEHLTFFYLHMECDDQHAIAIESELMRRRHEPAWFERCLQAMNEALLMRAEFFDALYDLVVTHRVRHVLSPIQSKRTLYRKDERYTLASGQPCDELYDNIVHKLDIDFKVTRPPFSPQVLDPRIVHIAPGKNNERHKHAHETVFYIVKGSGSVEVDGNDFPVATGDMVFVPRWAMHQSRNGGAEEMIILAITDYGLTGRAFVGNYLSTARLKAAESATVGEQPAHGAVQVEV